VLDACFEELNRKPTLESLQETGEYLISLQKYELEALKIDMDPMIFRMDQYQGICTELEVNYLDNGEPRFLELTASHKSPWHAFKLGRFELSVRIKVFIKSLQRLNISLASLGTRNLNVFDLGTVLKYRRNKKLAIVEL
jgi:hypothetical protein